MTPLRQRMIEDLRLRNRSPHTVEAYVGAVAQFARHFGRSPEHLDGGQARAYLLHLVQDQHASWSRYNQARCALQFLYGSSATGSGSRRCPAPARRGGCRRGCRGTRRGGCWTSSPATPGTGRC